MGTHRIYLHEIRHGTLTVEGDEAHHAARVKRLIEGDAVELLDGRGGVGEARIASIAKERGAWRLVLQVAALRCEEPVRPRIEVCAPAPKGPRLADMVDGLSQSGAASWSRLESERAVTEPRRGKLERLDRTAWEAAKQCGRAWVLEIGPPVGLEAALRGAGGERIVVADASGERYTASGAATIRLLIGAEGGWSARELELARSAGATVARFGPHAMRIETAAVVASAIIFDSESRGR